MSSVLVVVNDSLLRLAIVSYLKFKGYSPVEPADIYSALAFIATCSVEAVLLDVHPFSERMKLLQAMRRRPSLRCVPVIALIASPYRSENFDDLGPMEYLQLPFDMPMLTWTLESLFQRSRNDPLKALNASG